MDAKDTKWQKEFEALETVLEATSALDLRAMHRIFEYVTDYYRWRDEDGDGDG